LDNPRIFKGVFSASAIAGGLTGIASTYNQTTEFATQLAEGMNKASHLLAPATALVQ
jgi:hypothetical protein